MKNFILVVSLFFITSNLKAQDTSFVKEVKISDELTNIRLNMEKSYKTYQRGMTLQVGGLFLAGTSYFTSSAFKTTNNLTTALLVGSAVLYSLGWVEINNSHRYFHNIGVGVSQNGMKVKYVF